MSRSNFRLGIFLGLWWLVSCSSDSSESKLPSTFDYYPLAVGNYHIYQVEETTVLPINKFTVENYYIKSMVIESFRNAEGTNSYILHRQRGESPNGPWAALDSWKAYYSGSKVVVAEGNVPYVKLTNPITPGFSWNGNAFNNEFSSEDCEGCDFYAFADEVEGAFQIPDGLAFDNTVEVIENNSERANLDDIRKSVYSKNVGLIYREFIKIEYHCPDACTDDIESGKKMYLKLVEHGRED